MQLTITAENFQELKQKVNDLHNEINDFSGEEKNEEVHSAEVEVEHEVREKKKPGRKPKALAAAAASAPSAPATPSFLAEPTAANVATPAENIASAPASGTAASVPSKDQVGAALEAVNAKFGLQKLKDLLTQFGVVRASNIPVEKYAEVIAACKKLTA